MMNKTKILVVDDELFFRQLLADLLEQEGYAVEVYGSGAEALERIRKGGIDLVLTDMVMPEISGLEILRAARSIENPPEVILVTGHATLESAIETLKSGARDYLVKPFNPEELKHLVRLCLEQRRLIDENVELKNQLRLYQGGQRLAASIDLENLLPQALDLLLRELGAGRGIAFIKGPDGNPQLLAEENIEEGVGVSLIRGLQSGMEEMRGLVEVRRRDIPARLPESSDVRDVLCCALRAQGVVEGGIVLINPVGGQLSAPRSSERLLFLCEQTALGFENAWRYLGARELMYSDDLTGLYNHRYMQIVLDQELRRSGRYGLEFSIIFMDLDNFKRLNDTYGHLAGSAILHEAGQLLRECVREADLLFRYGGDEFTVLLVETDERGASVVAERIRRCLENHSFLAEEGIGAHLTATLGFATFPGDAEDKTRLLDLADRAMYWGKRQRNTVCGVREMTTK